VAILRCAQNDELMDGVPGKDFFLLLPDTGFPMIAALATNR
jgi:hypothetical protein